MIIFCPYRYIKVEFSCIAQKEMETDIGLPALL